MEGPPTARLAPAAVHDPAAFAVDFATLAREIAQDIFPLEQVIRLHKLSDEEWLTISIHPRFVRILSDMQREWNAASNTAERIKVKAQAGLETQLETFIADMGDPTIPLAQRTETARMLARLGELDGQNLGGADGSRFVIQLNIGATHVSTEAKPAPKVIDHAD